jgi:hypothetical protein
MPRRPDRGSAGLRHAHDLGCADAGQSHRSCRGGRHCPAASAGSLTCAIDLLIRRQSTVLTVASTSCPPATCRRHRARTEPKALRLPRQPIPASTAEQVWQVYHLTAGLPVVIDLALEVDLLSEGGPGQKADRLFYLSREAFRRHLIDELWRARAATGPKSISAALLSDTLIEELRKELRRRTGHNAEPKELSRLLRETVIRPDSL